MVEVFSQRDLTSALLGPDPAFGLSLYVAAHGWGGMLFIQTLSAAAVTAGLWAFCKEQPRPWLSLVVALPYFVIVVGMGYIRQAIAISLLMLGIKGIMRGSPARYVLWVSVGALFHFTALLMLPLGMLSRSRKRIYTIFLGASAAAASVYFLSLNTRFDVIYANYVGAELDSSGAFVRIVMMAIPCALFLGVFRKRFDLQTSQQSFLTVMSAAGLALALTLIVSASSTAVDRVALYWLPFQMLIWSRIPAALAASDNATHRQLSSVAVVAVIIVYGASLFVWLVYAVNSRNWLPYVFYFLR
jgi:hypothetical protein